MDLYNEIMALEPSQRELVLADVDTLTDSELEEAYDAMLDDCFDSPGICGHFYTASHALRLVDPVAYRCGFADFAGDSEIYIEIMGNTYYAADVSAALEAYQEDQDND